MTHRPRSARTVHERHRTRSAAMPNATALSHNLHRTNPDTNVSAAWCRVFRRCTGTGLVVIRVPVLTRPNTHDPSWKICPSASASQRETAPVPGVAGTGLESGQVNTSLVGETWHALGRYLSEEGVLEILWQRISLADAPEPSCPVTVL